MSVSRAGPLPLASSRKGRANLVPLALAVSLVAAALFLLAWEATSGSWISPVFLPSPGSVIHEAAKLAAGGDLLNDVLVSSRRVFAGFGLAALIAVPLGVVMAVWWPAKAALDPFISLLRPLPSITWIPLTISGLASANHRRWRVDPLLIRAARNLGASDIAVMREVILPGALPGILSGLKVTLAIAWFCVLSAEMVAAQDGLGAQIWQAKGWGDLALVLVGMAGISITVLIADLAAAGIERLLLPRERHRRG